MKRNDEINENSINDLIQYAEDDFENDDFSNYESDDFDVADNTDDDKFVDVDSVYDLGDIDGFEEAMSDIDDDIPKYHFGKKSIIICIIVIAALFGLKMCSLSMIGNYKSNFSANISRFIREKPEKVQIPESSEEPKKEYITEIENSNIISFEDASEAEFVPYRNGILCAKMNYMSYINQYGEAEWEIDTAIVNPILKTNGGYILLAERGNNKICLYSDNKLIYDVDDSNSIMSASLSSNGDVVLVTGKTSYRGGISVYNKSGLQIFAWSSGSDTVICADISSSTRKIAVALLNTDETIKTVIQLFDVNRSESYARAELPDTVVYELAFVGDKVNAFGDNRLTGISSNGEIIYDNVFDNVSLVHSAYDLNGNKLLAFNDGNMPILCFYNKKGVQKSTVTLDGVADNIDVRNKYILYGVGRDIYFGKTEKMSLKYTATMDIRGLVILSENTFAVIYSNSIELVTI